MSTWAIIPARGGSRRIKHKNLKKIAGEPLVGIAAMQAIKSERIDNIIINTNDNEIRKVAESYDVRVSSRPQQYTQEDTMMVVDQFLTWQVKTLKEQGHEVDTVTLLYPTSPLRTIDDIDDTIALVNEKNYDSSLTLSEDTSYLWEVQDGQASPINYDPKQRGPGQLEDWNQWVENKAVYCFDSELLLSTGCRLGGKIGFVEMEPLRSVDIDTPDDLELAKKIVEIDGKSW